MMVKFPSIVYKDVYCVRLSSKSKGCFNISTLNLFLISLTKIQNEKKLHLDTWYSNLFSLEILKTFLTMTLLIVHIVVLILGIYNRLETDSADNYNSNNTFKYTCLFQLQEIFRKDGFIKFRELSLEL